MLLLLLGSTGSLGDVVLGVYEHQQCPLLTETDGQVRPVLGSPVLPPPHHLCSSSRYFLRHIWTQPCMIRAVAEGERWAVWQKIKPAGERDSTEDVMEV